MAFLHTNNDIDLRPVHTTQGKFKNAALFVGLGLPFTFSKTHFEPEESENTAFRFSVVGKDFENGAFRKL